MYRAGRDDQAVSRLRLGRRDEPAVPLSPRARATGVGGVRPADPARLRLDDPRASARWDEPGLRRLHRRQELLFDSIRRRGLDVDDDQRTGRPSDASLRAGRRGAGRAGTALRGTARTTCSRSTRARGNYIFPPRPTMRITTDLFAYCHERLRRFNTISISGYHIREADPPRFRSLRSPLPNGIALRGGCRRRRGSRRTTSVRGFVLLQRPQPLFPGGRQVRAARRLWAGSCAIGLGQRTEGAGARFHAQTGGSTLTAPPAGEQHRSRRDPGAVCGRRRRAVDPQKHSTRRSPCRPSAPRRSRCGRSRSLRTKAGETDTADPSGVVLIGR